MKHFFTNRIRVVMVAAVLLAVALAVISSLTGLKLPQMLVQGVLSPFRAGVSKLADRSQQLYDYIFEYESQYRAENSCGANTYCGKQNFVHIFLLIIWYIYILLHIIP